MKRLLSVSIAIAVLAVGTCLSLAILDGRNLIKAQFGVAQKEGQKTRDLLDAHAKQVEKIVRDQVGGIRRDTLSVVREFRTTADQRLGDALDRYDATLRVADVRSGQALQEVADIHADIKPTLDNLAGASITLKPILDHVAVVSNKAADIATHVDDALPAFTDCAYLDDAGEPTAGNPDCVFNRYQGASKAFENTMLAIAIAAPAITKSADSVAGSVAKEATKLTAPTTFWEGVRTWLLLLSRCAAWLLL
jgi:hypothetical protein